MRHKVIWEVICKYALASCVYMLTKVRRLHQQCAWKM